MATGLYGVQRLTKGDIRSHTMSKDNRVQHSLETEEGWKDYGRANALALDLWDVFLGLWAGLGRDHPEFDHLDQKRFWKVFKQAADKKVQQMYGPSISPSE